MNIIAKTTEISGHKALYYEISTKGTPAHFYGANGFPTLTYTPLLASLKDNYAIKSLSFRACWDEIPTPKKPISWKTYALDLVHFIEQNYNEPIVGIGHSQGATATMLAYHIKPSLFKQLILIEPGSVSNNIRRFFNPLPFFIKKQFKPVNSTKGKKHKWKNTDELFQFLRENKGYKRINDTQLFELAGRSLNQNNELTFPPIWETFNYARPVNLDKNIQNIKIPTTIIAGKPSLFMSKEVRAKWQLLNPQLEILENNKYGHLFPLEAPLEVSNLVKKIRLPL